MKAARLSLVQFYRRAMVKGVGAAIEHERTFALLAVRGVDVCGVVDVGANVGQFTLVVRHLFPAAKIFAFEPLQDAARKFRTVFGVDRKVQLFQAAIGEVCSEMEIHVSRAAVHDVIDWLHQHGFYLAQIGTQCFDTAGVSIPGDFLFLRRENR